MSRIILYASIASRSVGAYWMLEELGVPYEVVEIDIHAGKQKSPDYLKINPSGKVPAISVDAIVVTERPAICAFLADRFGYGTLAPKIEASLRGPYLQWIVYAGSVLDPAINMRALGLDAPSRAVTWGTADDVVARLAGALENKQWLLGDWFTAADVALGAVLTWALFNRQLPENAVLSAYGERLTARPAFKRAAELTWPPRLFAGGS